MSSKEWSVAVLVAGVQALIACNSKAPDPVPEPQRPVATAAVAPPEPEKPIDRIKRAETFAAAVDATKSFMTDTSGDLSPGTVFLAAWGSTRLKWEDVAVVKNETSYAKVQKEADEERGKRLCVSGSIIQIAAEKTSMGKFYDGILSTNGGNLFRFVNVGSSGELVERSQARMCGAVTGKYSYPNSGGGTGHAVQFVGMFDLPENRPAPQAAQ